MSIDRITDFSQCVSRDERKLRFTTTLVNLFIWTVIVLVMVAFVIGMIGVSQGPEMGPFEAVIGFCFIFVFVFGSGFFRYLFAEYNVRKLQALGATVSSTQFPAIHEAVQEIRERFGVKGDLRVIVLASGEANAFAIRFARKRVVVLLSELLEGIMDNRQELLSLLGHEICHIVLDHGFRGLFERYKSARYKAAREMTCDNAGYVAARDAEAAKTMLKKLCAGKVLHTQLSDQSLAEEARQIYSGLTGWFLRQYLTYPPFGKRIRNVDEFAAQFV